MNGGSTSSSRLRVVVLSRDAALGGPGLCGQGAPGRVAIRVSSAYEAAAEVLADTPAVLVIDLRALGARHGRLLEIARARNVAMLGVGTLSGSLSADELSGVRLTAIGELPGVIDALAAARPSPAAAAPAEMPAHPPAAQGRPAAPERPASPAGPAQADEVDEADEAGARGLPPPQAPPRPAAPEPVAPAPAAASPRPQGTFHKPIRPDQILTVDEVAALLSPAEAFHEDAAAPQPAEAPGEPPPEAPAEARHAAEPRTRAPVPPGPAVTGLAGAYMRVTAQAAAHRARGPHASRLGQLDARRAASPARRRAHEQPDESQELLSPEDLAALLEDEA